MSTPRVGLIGVGGYGAVHAEHLKDFHRRGEIIFAAAVAFQPAPDGSALAQLAAVSCQVCATFEEFVAAMPGWRLDLVVVPTPIHLHARMVITLLRAGVDVLVEKPLAASVEDVQAIAEVSAVTGRRVAVGFQYLHAPEVLALKQRLHSGVIGPLRRLVVHAAWPRSHAYYTRNAWAGRRRIGPDAVLDSPVSNAMSHFLMVTLFLGGTAENQMARPVRMNAELYRAQAIESFDTAVLQLETAEAVRLEFYGTHSSRDIGRPSIRIEGKDGNAEWVQDSHAQISSSSANWAQLAGPESSTREQMLRDVLAWRRNPGAFICTPEMAAIHVRCITELDRKATIVDIPAGQLAYHRTYDDQLFTYVRGLDQQLLRAASAGTSLVAVGAAWAVPPGPWWTVEV